MKGLKRCRYVQNGLAVARVLDWAGKTADEFSSITSIAIWQPNFHLGPRPKYTMLHQLSVLVYVF